MDHAPLNFYEAKSSDQISSDQNRCCPQIHFYVFYFLALDKNKARSEKKWVYFTDIMNQKLKNESGPILDRPTLRNITAPTLGVKAGT